MKNANAPCPCHSGAKYKKCCRPFHEGEAAPSPEKLMRSRYAAYALGLADYIIDTTSPGGPGSRADRATWTTEVLAFSKATKFQGLAVLEAGEQGDRGFVRFRAKLARGSDDASFEERSGFVRVNGRWLYASQG